MPATTPAYGGTQLPRSHSLHPVRRSLRMERGKVASIKIILGPSAKCNNRVSDDGNTILYQPPRTRAQVQTLLDQEPCVLLIVGCAASTWALGWYYADNIEGEHIVLKRHATYDETKKPPSRPHHRELDVDSIESPPPSPASGPTSVHQQQHKPPALQLPDPLQHASQLERDWISVFERSGVTVEYETFSVAIDIDGGRHLYTPDLVLRASTPPILIEIKPFRPDAAALERSRACARAVAGVFRHVMVCGRPHPPMALGGYDTIEFAGEQLVWNQFMSVQDTSLVMGLSGRPLAYAQQPRKRQREEEGEGEGVAK